MAILKIDLSPPPLSDGAAVPTIVPTSIGLTTPAIGIPLPKLPQVAGAFSFGVEVKFTCPGKAICGKIGEDACSVTCKSPVLELDPTKYLPLKLPGLPTMIGIPSKELKVVVPPKPFNLLKCPNFNKKA